jgi:hypothetical protein
MLPPPGSGNPGLSNGWLWRMASNLNHNLRLSTAPTQRGEVLAQMGLAPAEFGEREHHARPAVRQLLRQGVKPKIRSGEPPHRCLSRGAR